MSTLKGYIYVGRSIFSDTNLINKIILHPTKSDIHWMKEYQRLVNFSSL